VSDAILTDTDHCSKWKSLCRRQFRRCRRHSAYGKEVVRCCRAYNTPSDAGLMLAVERTVLCQPSHRSIHVCLGRRQGVHSRAMPPCSSRLQFKPQHIKVTPSRH